MRSHIMRCSRSTGQIINAVHVELKMPSAGPRSVMTDSASISVQNIWEDGQIQTGQMCK